MATLKEEGFEILQDTSILRDHRDFPNHIAVRKADQIKLAQYLRPDYFKFQCPEQPQQSDLRTVLNQRHEEVNNDVETELVRRGRNVIRNINATRQPNRNIEGAFEDELEYEEQVFSDLPTTARDMPRAHLFVHPRVKARSEVKLVFSDISCNELFGANLRQSVRLARNVNGSNAAMLLEFGIFRILGYSAELLFRFCHIAF